MAIIKCDRKGCGKFEGVNRYSSDHGYICDECFEELVGSSYTDAARFMECPKEINEMVRDVRVRVFNKYFPKISED